MDMHGSHGTVAGMCFSARAVAAIAKAMADGSSALSVSARYSDDGSGDDDGAECALVLKLKTRGRDRNFQRADCLNFQTTSALEHHPFVVISVTVSGEHVEGSPFKQPVRHKGRPPPPPPPPRPAAPKLSCCRPGCLCIMRPP
jgi:hypothetical protein